MKKLNETNYLRKIFMRRLTYLHHHPSFHSMINRFHRHPFSVSFFSFVFHLFALPTADWHRAIWNINRTHYTPVRLHYFDAIALLFVYHNSYSIDPIVWLQSTVKKSINVEWWVWFDMKSGMLCYAWYNMMSVTLVYEFSVFILWQYMIMNGCNVNKCSRLKIKTAQ